MEPLPTALADLMRRRNMNATALAAAAGVTDATVSYYLSGKRGKVIEDPDVQITLSQFSDALGVPMTYWFEYRLLAPCALHTPDENRGAQVSVDAGPSRRPSRPCEPCCTHGAQSAYTLDTGAGSPSDHSGRTRV